MSNYLKPQTPIQLNENYIYPLTTADQVILNNGNRLNSLFKKTIKETVVLRTTSWSETKPYTQTITLTESTDDYNVDANVAYGDGDNVALNKAAGCISYIKKNHKNITFYCLKSKPEVDIPIEITGTCRNTIATIEEGIKLNFDIVAYATEEELLAGTPAENTIGVITDTPITGYKFSATEPENMVDGEVWIKTGDDSSFTFDIVEGAKMYPILSKQCINGVLIDVIAMIYQDDVWMELAIYLFNHGKQSYKWQARAWAASNYTPVAPTVSVNSDGSVTLTVGKASSGYNSGVYEMVEDFDLTNVDTLVVKGANIYGGVAIYIVDRNSQHWAYPNSIASGSFNNDECLVDTSQITGSYDILIGLFAGTDSAASVVFKTLRVEGI